MEDQLYYKAVLHILSGVTVDGANTNFLRLLADAIDETKRRHDALAPKTDDAQA